MSSRPRANGKIIFNKNKMLSRLLLSISIFLLQACQTVGGLDEGPVTAAETELLTPVPAPAPEPAYLPPADEQDLWVRVQRQLSLVGSDQPGVTQARQRYLREDNYVEIVSSRAAPYLYFIVEEVERRGMPIEIALLPMVESAFNPFAVSPDRAAGLWQIMPRTGAQLGLTQDWWYDGRYDLRHSTRAALDYLEQMHASLGEDWLLALAAYNSGKGRVMRAQRKNREAGKPTDFWSLKLPRETRHYVPRLLALSSILADPQAHGVELAPLANEPYFEPVATGGQIELERAAELANMETVDLLRLNPGHLRWATSPDQPDELLIPRDLADQFNEQVTALPSDQRVTWQHYRIENGDTLITIARRFDTQVGTLRAVNGIKGSLIRAGDELMIPNSTRYTASVAMNTRRPGQRTGYQVRRGDSLYRIAGKFNVKVGDIVSWNSLDPAAYLQPGQKLTIYVGGG